MVLKKKIEATKKKQKKNFVHGTMSHNTALRLNTPAAAASFALHEKTDTKKI